MQKRLERTKYSEAQLLVLISEQVLKGNYINFSLLVSVADGLKVEDIDLKKTIAETITRCDEECAQSTNSHALMLRGFFFQKGIGSSTNYPESIRFYDHAIFLGNPVAMNNRAFMYQHGRGGSVDYAKAIALYEQAMDLGDADAMNNRASMYHKGQGGLVDHAEAIVLYEQAIALGNSTAMVNRAYMHQSGEGGSIDLAKTIVLYEQAIRLGSGGSDLAQKNLQRISISSYTAPILLSMLWNDLVKGISFSMPTLSALSRHCKKMVLERINASDLGTSLVFLKQLKSNSQHPLTVIINDGKINEEGAEFKKLMKRAHSICGERYGFFCGQFSLPLPPEIKSHIFSFIQPGMNYDRKEGQKQDILNEALKKVSLKQDFAAVKKFMEEDLENKPSEDAVYEALRTATENGHLPVVKQLSSYLKLDDEYIETLCFSALECNQVLIIAWLAHLKTYSAYGELIAEAQTPMDKIRVLINDYGQSNFMKNLWRYRSWSSPYVNSIEKLLFLIDHKKINAQDAMNFLNAFQSEKKLQKTDPLSQIIAFLNEIIYVVETAGSLTYSFG